MLEFRVLMVTCLGLAACGVVPAWCGEQSLLDRCWTPQALAGTPAEVKPALARTPLDLTPLKRETLPPPTPLPPELRGSIRSVELPDGVKLIALTFDLCETNRDVAGYDGRIVDLLRAQDVKATFFAGGKWIETHQERAEQLLADPHFEVGSHNFAHLDPLRITPATLGEEISLTEAAYVRAERTLEARQCFAVPVAEPDASATPAADASAAPPLAPLTLMRFPYGRCNPKTLAQAADARLISIQWDIISGDPDPHRSAKAIASTILSKAHPGAIVVAHANGRGYHTAEALELVIPKLKERGYNFVTVSELLAAGKPVSTPSCYQNTPGDTARLARATHPTDSHDIWSVLKQLN